MVILVVLVGIMASYHLIEGIGAGGMPAVVGTRVTATIMPTAMPKATATSTSKDRTSTQKLVWDDEFNGAMGAPPDPEKWTAEVGGDGWGNEQLEYDTKNQNAYQDGQGHLVLEARKNSSEGFQCWYGPCQFTSARISTRGHFSFTYGRLEADIKIPSGQGIWSAFWLLGSDCATVGWPACGEIDIMENIGREPTTNHGTVHGPVYFSKSYEVPRGTLADAYHVFALQWDPSHLYFFVDGNNYATFDKADFTQQGWVFDRPFYIVLNVAVGGVWPGSPDNTTVFPQKMYISYIRLYKYA